MSSLFVCELVGGLHGTRSFNWLRRERVSYEYERLELKVATFACHRIAFLFDAQ